MAEEANQKQEAAADSAGSPAPRAQKPVLLIMLVIMNMIAVVATGLMFYLGKQKEASKISIENVVGGEHETQKAEKEHEVEFIGKAIPLETFLINLAGSRGRRIAKINMELEVQGDKIEEELDIRKAQIRDMVIILLSSKTYDEVSTRQGIDFLRDEVRDTLNGFLTKGKITKVYFTEFIYN